MFAAPDPNIVVYGGPKSQLNSHWNISQMLTFRKWIRKEKIEKVYGKVRKEEVR